MAPKDQFFTSNDVSNGAREVEKGVSVADSGRGWCGEMELRRIWWPRITATVVEEFRIT